MKFASIATLGLFTGIAVACGDPGGADETLGSSEQAATLLEVPGLVMGLLHNQNQTSASTVMLSADPNRADQRMGGDLGAALHRGFEWWSLRDTTANSTGWESKLPPGVVVALKHSQNQSSVSITAFGRNATTGPASFPGFQRHVGGDRGASSGVGYYWYESTGTAFTSWASIDSLLPKYTVVGLKHSQNQSSKTFRWNGVTYDPVKTSPVPPGFRRMVGGDMGASSGQGFYWYEKTTGSEIVTRPSFSFTLSRSLYMHPLDPGAVDKDGDCLADDAEDELGRALRPLAVFDNQESARRASEPAGVFRVYPQTQTAVHVKFLMLFEMDGGYGPSSWCPSDSHPGDNDNIDFYLSGSNGGRTWTLARFSVGNAGIAWPINSRLETHAGRSPVVYMSASKHHQYLTRDNDGKNSPYSAPPGNLACNDDVNGLGARVFVTALGFNGSNSNNVGEPGRHPASRFVNSLDPTFPGKTIWGGELFYSSACGSNSSKFPAVQFPACAWNNCSHSPCVEGPPLSPACFDDAAKICSFDEYCCTTWWDHVCVSEVASGCN